MSLPEDAPCPRLCHLIKWPDFNGYGFNLHAEKSKQGQYIGKVDDDSPAHLAGLREGDKIIEVNFVNICNENHRQVVERIKSITNETWLLVIDDYTDRWYRERKMVVKSGQPNVIYYRTPVPRPAESGLDPLPCKRDASFMPSNRMSLKSTTGSIGSGSSNASGDLMDHHQNHNHVNQVSVVPATTTTSTDPDGKDQEEAEPPAQPHEELSSGQESPIATNGSHHRSAVRNPSLSSNASSNKSTSTNSKTTGASLSSSAAAPAMPSVNYHRQEYGVNNSNDTESVGASSSSCSTGGMPSLSTTGGESAPTPPPPPATANDSNGELNLNMTAAQMRQLIAQRKKKDVKNTNIDLRKKYEIIQQM